jgi:ethanolamine utilization protein EutA (predicted chaperonin)
VVPPSATPAIAAVPDFPSVIALLGTLVLYWLVYAYAAQVAAVFLLGEAPWRYAAVVGVIFAVVNVALIRYDPLIILPVALLADVAGFRVVYDVPYRLAVPLALLHGAVSVAFGVAIAYVLTLLSTAPA